MSNISRGIVRAKHNLNPFAGRSLAGLYNMYGSKHRFVNFIERCTNVLKISAMFLILSASGNIIALLDVFCFIWLHPGDS